jgi:large subunit ribosomal protein L27e
LILKGRFSGSKAFVLSKEGKIQSKKFDHLLLIGMKKYPLNISRKMSIYRISKRCSMKIFVKIINTEHVLPTRYTIDLEQFYSESLKNKIRDFIDYEKKKNYDLKLIKKERTDFCTLFKNILLDKFYSGKYSWFFKKLKF